MLSENILVLWTIKNTMKHSSWDKEGKIPIQTTYWSCWLMRIKHKPSALWLRSMSQWQSVKRKMAPRKHRHSWFQWLCEGNALHGKILQMLSSNLQNTKTFILVYTLEMDKNDSLNRKVLKYLTRSLHKNLQSLAKLSHHPSHINIIPKYYVT